MCPCDLPPTWREYLLGAGVPPVRPWVYNIHLGEPYGTVQLVRRPRESRHQFGRRVQRTVERVRSESGKLADLNPSPPVLPPMQPLPRIRFPVPTDPIANVRWALERYRSPAPWATFPGFHYQGRASDMMPAGRSCQCHSYHMGQFRAPPGKHLPGCPLYIRPYDWERDGL